MGGAIGETLCQGCARDLSPVTISRRLAMRTGFPASAAPGRPKMFVVQVWTIAGLIDQPLRERDNRPTAAGLAKPRTGTRGWDPRQHVVEQPPLRWKRDVRAKARRIEPLRELDHLPLRSADGEAREQQDDVDGTGHALISSKSMPKPARCIARPGNIGAPCHCPFCPELGDRLPEPHRRGQGHERTAIDGPHDAAVDEDDLGVRLRCVRAAPQQCGVALQRPARRETHAGHGRSPSTRGVAAQTRRYR
jgi:hypothetical protein